MDGVFFLANGFAMGEKAEIFWSMRAYEIAIEVGSSSSSSQASITISRRAGMTLNSEVLMATVKEELQVCLVVPRFISTYRE